MIDLLFLFLFALVLCVVIRTNVVFLAKKPLGPWRGQQKQCGVRFRFVCSAVGRQNFQRGPPPPAGPGLLKIPSTHCRTNKTKSNTTLFLLVPPRTKWFFSQEKQRLFVSQHKGLTQTRKRTRCQSRRHLGLIFYIF